MGLGVLGSTHNEWQGRDVGEEKTRSARSHIANQDFDQEHDTCVSDLDRIRHSSCVYSGVSHLIDHSTGGESLHIRRTCFNDSSHGVEDDRDEDEFRSAEYICNLSRSGLWREMSVSSMEFRASGIRTCAAAAITARKTLIVASRLCWP